MYKYKVNTYGCQMNVHESEKIAGMLESLGYEKTEDDEKADVVVFNTCCVRESAETHAVGNIGMLKPLKEKNKNLIVAVGGCMTQQDGKAKKLKETFPFIDIVFGTHNLSLFKEYLEKRLKTGEKTVEIADNRENIEETTLVKRTSYPNAWVNVMYGCDNFCTYCIVPYVRGREISRPPKDILAEVKSLIKDGYKEITLLGQNVDSYVGDGEIKDFSDLLKKVDEIDGDFRIRFMSNHPKDVNEKLIGVIKNSGKICKSVHLPVQSGSTRILALMNRKYTREEYLKKVELIRKELPDCAITTDIMVGFPTETDEDFRDSITLLEQVGFDGAFTFVYSKRSGTVAADMDGQIDKEVKKARIIKMVAVQNAVNAEKSKKYHGKVFSVLCEDYDGEKSLYSGRDESGRMIYFKSDKNVLGDFVNVLVTKTGGISLFGEIV